MRIQQGLRSLIGSICVFGLFAGVAQADSNGEARVRADLEAFFAGQMAGDAFVVEVPSLSGFNVKAERFPGTLRTELSTRSRPPFQGRVAVSVALYAGDQLVKRSVVTPYLRVMEKVVVPARDLKPGTVLMPTDLIEVERDRARLPKNVVRDPAFAVGQRTKGSLRKDRPFRTSQIEGVPVVERGDRVQLVLKTGALVIQSAGKAQQSGVLGEWIRVINVDSKRELSGRVDQEGRVHVSF